MKVRQPEQKERLVARPAAPSKRGRPKKGAAPALLADWLEVNRPGEYRSKTPLLYVCIACREEIPVYRRGESGKRSGSEARPQCRAPGVDLQDEDVNLYNKREIQAVLGIKSAAGQVQTIKKLLQSITVPARTERLCQFIENSVRNLHFLDTSDGERQSLTALCNSFAQDVKQGSVDRSRLELAAKVAAGGPNVWVP